MYRYLTKLSLGAVASAAVIVVGFASMTGSAYATHDPAHSIEEIKGGLKSLEGRVCRTPPSRTIPPPPWAQGG